MFIADRYHVIRETEEYQITEEMIEKLDSMLTEYGVQHFFTEPHADSETGFAKDDEVLDLYYEEKDEKVWVLVYALWLKTVRGYDKDEKIGTAVAKAFKALA